MGELTALEQLQQDNARLRRALNAAISGILVLDASYTVRFMNAGWADMHGLASPQVALGKSPFDLLFSQEQVAEVLRVVDESGHWEGTISGIRQDDSEPLMIWASVSQPVSQSKESDYVFIGTNYTKQRLKELQLEETKEQLKQHSKEVEQLNSLMTGREMKMIDLKKEINRLRTELDRCSKHTTTE